MAEQWVERFADHVLTALESLGKEVRKECVSVPSLSLLSKGV